MKISLENILKISLEQAKAIQQRFNEILEFAPDLEREGICRYLYYGNKDIRGVFDEIFFGGYDIYDVIDNLMDFGDYTYIGTEIGYNDERIMFLLMYTEISAEDFRDILNSDPNQL